MSDNFIPIVSNTPPPMDDDNFDDDFGNFTSANNEWDDGNDSDFGDFSGPPPFSDDSIGSPCKSATSVFAGKEIGNTFIPIKDENNVSKPIETTHTNENMCFNGFNSGNEHNEIEELDKVKEEVASSGSVLTNTCLSADSKTDDSSFQNNNHKYILNRSPSPPDDDTAYEDEDNTTVECSSMNSKEDQLYKHENKFNDLDKDVNFKNTAETTSNVDGSCDKPPTLDAFPSSPKFVSSKTTDVPSIAPNLNSDRHFEFANSYDSKSNDSAEISVSNVNEEEDKSVTPEENECSDKTFVNQNSHFNHHTFSDDTSGHFSHLVDSGINKENENTVSDATSDNNIACNNDTIVRDDADHGFAAFASFDSFDQSSKGVSSNNQIQGSQLTEETLTSADFDDFAHFESAVVSNQSQIDQQMSTKSEENLNSAVGENLDDEFADFAGFEVKQTISSTTETNKHSNLETQSISQVTSCTNSDNFADFGNDAFATFQAADDDDDDGFGDFGTIDNTVTFTQDKTIQPFSATSAISKVLKWFPANSIDCKDDLEDAVKQINDHIHENHIALFHSCSNPKNSAKQSPNKNFSRPTELWDLLKDIDNAIALKFHWNTSHHHQQLLSALGINTRNILFSESATPYYVPMYYAAGLGLLEPDKDTSPMSAADKITASSPRDKSSASANGDADWTVETNDVIGACDNVGVANSLAPASVLDATSLNLDVLESSSSHLSSTSVASSSGQDKLDPELLELAMKVTPDVAPSKKVDPLSKILATLKASSSKKTEEDEEELSSEATTVITKLPDLSYMRSRVLMFPVRQSTF